MRTIRLMGWLAVAALALGAEGRAADDIPVPFQPFEPMIGAGKGTAKPAANPLKGWEESHGWAWKCEKGKPVGVSVSFEGDKTLTKATIQFDAASKKYKLVGTDPQGKPVTFEGGFGKDGKTLTFDRSEGGAGGKERITIRPNANSIRYTLQIDRQEAGAPQFKSFITVGLTKEGESFAAGAAASNLPKCIMTGGAATITVSYMGKSYPVCCTGCRDEFNENPAKYAKLADAAASASPSKDKPADKPASKGSDDGSFDGLLGEEKSKMEPGKPASSKTPAKGQKAESTGTSTGSTTKDAPKNDSEVKAKRELQMGQNFEKDGKTSLALTRYKKIVKDFPDTEAAKTATARIKALESK